MCANFLHACRPFSLISELTNINLKKLCPQTALNFFPCIQSWNPISPLLSLPRERPESESWLPPLFPNILSPATVLVLQRYAGLYSAGQHQQTWEHQQVGRDRVPDTATNNLWSTENAFPKLSHCVSWPSLSVMKWMKACQALQFLLPTAYSHTGLKM